METNEYRNLYDLEDHYWWYAARRSLTRQFLREVLTPGRALRIADFGCGTGANERVLRDFGPVILVDRSPEALSFCRKRGLRQLLLSSAETIALRDHSIDAATSLDVFEHLDNDLAGMKEIARVLKPGGVLLVTVPAFGFLWSEHDEALHHRRRYTSYELRNKLTAAGLDPIRTSYFICFLFAPIAIVRIWQGIFKRGLEPKTSHVILPTWVNRLILGILAFERFLCRHMNLPIGVSIICVARKRG